MADKIALAPTKRLASAARLPPTRLHQTVLTSCTSRSASGNGTGAKTTALNTEKIAVFAPMPVRG
jgi:hypothetical protein